MQIHGSFIRQYCQERTGVLSRKYRSTAKKVLEYCQESTGKLTYYIDTLIRNASNTGNKKPRSIVGSGHICLNKRSRLTAVHYL